MTTTRKRITGLSPQFIMRCGIKDYLKESEEGRKEYNTPPRDWDTPETHKLWAEGEIENLNWFSHYANGRGLDEGKMGILTADWNHVSRRTQDILEAAGWELEWSDQIMMCDHCNGAARTDPSYIGDPWTVWIDDEGGVLCRKCAVEEFPEEYIGWALNNPNRAVRMLDPGCWGFRLENPFYDWTSYKGGPVVKSYESGFHPGQNDDPKTITKDLRKKWEAMGVEQRDILFSIDDVGQFDVSFLVWSREKDWQGEYKGWELCAECGHTRDGCKCLDYVEPKCLNCGSTREHWVVNQMIVGAPVEPGETDLVCCTGGLS